MKQSTFSAQVANKLLTVLQGYTKGIRFVAVLTMLITVGIGSAWGATDVILWNGSNPSYQASTTEKTSTDGAIKWVNSDKNSYSNPTRIYSGNTLTISVANTNTTQITKIEAVCTSTSYAEAFGGTSVEVTGGGTASRSVSGSTTTITITGKATAVAMKMSAQSRVSKLTVTYETATSYTVNWTINPTEGGDLSSTSGSSITVTPDAAYTYDSPAYEVTSGKATVSQSGNTFTATPTANSTIQINMVEKPKYTVTLVPGSGSVTSTTLTESSAGAGVILPTATIDCGDVAWNFAGWAEASVATETEEAPSTLYEADDTYKPTSNITLYAVYQRTETTEGGGSVTSQTDEVTISDFGTGTSTRTYSSAYASWTWAKNSGSNIATYDEIRLYANHSMKISPKSGYTISSIVATCTSSSYANALAGSKLEGANKSVSGSTVTITPTSGDIVITQSAQSRVSKFTVTYSTTAGGTTITTYYHSTPECSTETLLFVTSTLSHVTADGSNPTTITSEAEDLTLSYSAESGWNLPATISVTMGGTPLSSETDYDWDNGDLLIAPASGFTGNIVVTINGWQQLAAPTGLNVTNITSTSATLSWGEVANASSYTVFITDLDDEEITLTDIEEASVDVTGLSPETLYLWDVVAIGDGANYTDSEHSSQEDPNAEFTTLNACEQLGAATNLTVETDFVHTDGKTYVKFSWTPADNTKNYAASQKLCFGKVDEAGTCVDNLAKNQTWTGDLASKLSAGEYWWSIQALGDGINYCDGDVIKGTNFYIYSITYNTNGGNTIEATSGTTLPDPLPIPTREHYNFEGWYTDQGLTQEATAGAQITQNTTLYAKWTANTYTITLDANGGTFTKDGNTSTTISVSYIYGTYATYDAAKSISAYLEEEGITLSREGHQLNEKWQSQGVPWTKIYTATGDRIIQAQWTEVDCRWIETDIANIQPEDEVLITMKRADDGDTYTLDHSKGTSELPPAQTITIHGNEAIFTTFYHSNSIWNISGNATDGYILYPNGSKTTWLYCTKSNNNVKVGTTTSNVFTIDQGYLKHTNTDWVAYLGVYIDNGNPIWRHHDSPTAPSIAGQTLKFYKRVCVDALNPWCTVTFNAGSGSCDTVSLTGTKNEGITLPTATPSDACDKDGWKFAGWWTEAVTETTTSPGELLISESNYKPEGDITLYAVYSKEETNEGGGALEEVSKTYTFSDYTAGTQYAENEQHKLDENVTLITTQCHFTSELRIYSSDDHNGYVVSKILPGRIVSIGINAGNKVDNVLVYGSTDGNTWTNVGSIEVTSTSYNDYTLDFGEPSYTYFKLDVEGANQVRLKSITITWESIGAGGGSTITYNSNPSCEVCENILTINKGVETNGTFTLSQSGNIETCDGVVEVVVTPTPTEHYSVSEVTATTPITGGTPTITDNGDGTWTVTYAQDSKGESTISVTFVEDAKASITLSELGVETTDNTTYYVGEQYTLPTTSSQSCEGKELVGWSTVEVAETDTKPTENYYELGAEVTLEAEQTFYAVFATAGEGGVDNTDYSNVHTSNVTLTNEGGTNATNSQVNIGGMDYTAVKAGTGSAMGAVNITVPSGTTKLSFHMAGWNGEGNKTISLSGATADPSSFKTVADAGVSGNNATYTLSGTIANYFYSTTLSNIDAETTLTFSNGGADQRFVIWGVNASTGGGVSYTGYTTSCVPTYTITYDFAGGTGSHCSNTTVPQGESYTICEDEPTKTGYTFLHWSDGTTTYAAGATITPTSNITLTAVWQINTYTVTWSNNGETDEETYEHGDPFVVPTNIASCDGIKEFVGWTTQSGYYHATDKPADLFTTKTEVVTATATYYAVFATKGEGSANFVLGESGTFKMYANVNGTNYYAQGGVSSSKITSTTEAANASDYTLTHKGNNQYTIQLGNTYIGHSGTSSTDLNTTETTWTIKEGVNGSWRIVSPVNTSRALAYRASTYKIFKAYSMTSVEAGDTEYYDIEFGGVSSGYSDYTTTCQQIESIEVQNPQTEFYLTDDFTIGTGKVIATLSGGETTDVTALATFSGYNMNVVGTYTVTVTYMGATATYDINVKPLDNAWVLTWNVSGKTNTGLGPRTVNKGSAIGTLPVPEVPAACEGKTFMGWTESNIVPSDGVGIVYITPETVPTDNTTYYAVFATVNNFSVQKPIEDIEHGSKVVVVAVASLTADGGSGKAISSRTISITSQGVIGLSGDEVSISDETINTPHSTCIWTLTKEGGGIVLEQDGKYIRAVDDGYRKLLLETTKDYWTLTPVEGKYQTYYMQSGNTEHYLEWFDHTDDKYDEGEKYIGFVPFIQANDYGDFDMQFFVTLGDNADITDYTTGCEEYTITYYGFRGGYSTSSSSDGIIVLPVNSAHTVPDCGDVVKDHTDLGREFLNLWMTEPHGGHTFKPGDTFILTQDTTLYAQWELNTTTDVTLPTGVEDLAGTDVYVYGGNTLTMVPDIVTINSLTLKGGLQPDGSYQMPNVWIPDGATLVRNTNKINLDLVVNAKNYYPFAVPFAAKNNQYVEYIDPTLAAASTYGTHFAIKTYDGARRAEVGEDKANNWVRVLREETLQPGVGYIITALTYPDKDTATIRIPMIVPNTWFENGEQTVVGTTVRNTIAVTAHAGAAATEHQRHAGWNFVANPYLTSFAGGNVANDGGLAYINGELIIQGSYEYGGDPVPYVTVPAYDFEYYSQHKLSDVKLSPEWSFFVQVGTGGTMNFTTAGRQQAPASIAARNAEERPVKMDIDINLTDGRNTDQMGIIVCEKYSDAYEIGRDLEKMFGSAYNLVVYSLMNDNTPLAYQAVPLLNETHAIPIGYRAPEQGEYTFSLKQNTSSIDLLNEQYEQLVLVDYEKGALTNLLNSDYTFSSERTQSNSRFALYAVPRQDSSTELPNISDEEDAIRKILYNGHLFIIRNGNVYNGNGQIVK